MKRMLGIISSALAIVGLAWAALYFVLREHRVDVIDAAQVSGGSIAVTIDRSHRYHWGHPHVLMLGGGDERVTLSFEHAGSSRVWSSAGHAQPRLLQVDRQGVPYLVVQGPMHDLRAREQLRFLRGDGQGWREITSDAFPRELATMNLWPPYGPHTSRELDPDRDHAEALLKRILAAGAASPP